MGLFRLPSSLAASLLLGTSYGQALRPQAGVFTGRVTTEAGRPLAKALVVVGTGPASTTPVEAGLSVLVPDLSLPGARRITDPARVQATTTILDNALAPQKRHAEASRTFVSATRGRDRQLWPPLCSENSRTARRASQARSARSD